MKLIIFLFALFLGVKATAQIVNHEVEPKGIYKEIDLSNDLKVCKLLLDTNLNNPQAALIDSVEHNANKYTPPVLYVLSNVLFTLKKYNEAAYWFYIAQLRARYDINRCTDKTADAYQYNETFGPVINNYAFTHLDSLEEIVPRVVEYVRSNEEKYDQRWINLSGLDAMGASLGNQPTTKKLSVDENKWAAIKTKTINDFYENFKSLLKSLRKK